MFNDNFCSDKKIGAIFGPFFGPKFGHFCSKVRFSAIFFQTVDVFLLIFGLSGLAVEAYGFTLVRASVRPSVTLYLEIRASDFDDFLHKAIS